MSNLDRLKWQPTCCEWSGFYAEHPLIAGGVARIKRSHQQAGVLVCRFGADNRAIDKGADGVPVYVKMTAAEADALLA